MLYQLLANHPSKAVNPRTINRSGLANIFETEDNWTVEILAPGFDKSDFTTNVENGRLQVKAVGQKEQRKYFKKEFGTFGINRKFKLPRNIDSEKITANLNAGILKIEIPKSEEAKPKSINIK